MSNPVENPLEQLIKSKAMELFDICDKEKKGFILKRDIQRLCSELAVEAGQLDNVFDSLDIDRNGFLTLDEFNCKTMSRT
jgi:Ca2+-binding EF-hand superfamily protein